MANMSNHAGWADRWERVTELQLTALVVIADKRRTSSLIPHLYAANVEVRLVETCREARTFLSRRPTTDLVIADVSVGDGNWCTIVRHVVDYAERAAIVVVSSDADERLWSEILWRGVYDLWIEPFDGHEVKRVIEGAMRGSAPGQPTSVTSIKKGTRSPQRGIRDPHPVTSLEGGPRPAEATVATTSFWAMSKLPVSVRWVKRRAVLRHAWRQAESDIIPAAFVVAGLILMVSWVLVFIAHRRIVSIALCERWHSDTRLVPSQVSSEHVRSECIDAYFKNANPPRVTPKFTPVR